MCVCNEEYDKEVSFVYIYKEFRVTLYYSWYQNLCQEGYIIAVFLWNHEEAFYSILHVFKEIKSMMR